MAKKGPLGKAESFYVEEKFKSGKSIEQIANDLDRSQSSIEEYIKINKINNPQTIISQQFARQSGATIMTESASSMIENKKNKKNINSNCISKIK